MHRTPVIALVTSKGGESKTTTAIHLADGLAELGYRPLLVDLDPQANLTLAVTEVREADGLRTVEDVLRSHAGVSRAGRFTLERVEVISTFNEHVRVAPALNSLGGVLDNIRNEPFARECLAKAIEQHAADDRLIVVLDTPPQRSLAQTIALTAATDIIIPMQDSNFSVDGMRQLVSDAMLYAEKDHLLAVLGILLTMVQRTTHWREFDAFLQDNYAGLPFSTAIPFSTYVRDALDNRTTVLRRRPKHAVAVAFMNFAREVDGRLVERHPGLAWRLGG